MAINLEEQAAEARQLGQTISAIVESRSPMPRTYARWIVTLGRPRTDQSSLFKPVDRWHVTSPDHRERRGPLCLTEEEVAQFGSEEEAWRADLNGWIKRQHGVEHDLPMSKVVAAGHAHIGLSL